MLISSPRREVITPESCTINGAPRIVRNGGLLVVTIPDRSRSRRGYLVAAAAPMQTETIRRMTEDARGQINVALPPDRCEMLDLTPVGRSSSRRFVPVNARSSRAPGLSAAERAETIRVLADPTRGREDLVEPGFVLPLQTHGGGVLARPEIPEAAVELAEAAGLPAAGVFCEILGDDDEPADAREVDRFAEAHGVPVLSIERLIAFRNRPGVTVRRDASATIPTPLGTFEAVGFQVGALETLALIRGAVEDQAGVPVRLQTRCLGSALGSRLCDCRAETDAALDLIRELGQGVLVLVPSQDELTGPAVGPFPSDGEHLACRGRDLGAAAQILDLLGIAGARLISDRPGSGEVERLTLLGISITDEIPLFSGPTAVDGRAAACQAVGE